MVGTFGFATGGAPSTGQVCTPEAVKWNPYHVSDALFDEAMQLAVEAEATIFLEEGEDTEVLFAWAAVDNALRVPAGAGCQG